MFSKVEYFYRQMCIIAASSYRLKVDENEYKVWTIRKSKFWNRALFVLWWMTEFVQWCLLCVEWATYFAENIETLIMNSLSLDFILDIDEMIFRVLTLPILSPISMKSNLYYPPKTGADKIQYCTIHWNVRHLVLY